MVVPPNGGVIKLITKYTDYGDSQTPFMFHCHILSHEDNGMMGQFIVTPDNTTGLPTLDKVKSRLIIYPNPVSEKLFFNLSETAGLYKFTYKIINSSGSIVRTFESSPITEIDVTNLPSGYYQLSLENESMSLLGKFIKK